MLSGLRVVRIAANPALSFAESDEVQLRAKDQARSQSGRDMSHVSDKSRTKRPTLDMAVVAHACPDSQQSKVQSRHCSD